MSEPSSHTRQRWREERIERRPRELNEAFIQEEEEREARNVRRRKAYAVKKKLRPQTFHIKPLDWRRASYREVTASGKPTITETWEAVCLLGRFIVYSAISGNCFAYLSGESKPSFKFPGIPIESKTPCKSIEDGKTLCEIDWIRKISQALIKARCVERGKRTS